MEDFDIPQNKLADSAERVVDRALDEARRREHALLTNEHVCLAFAQAEWDMFGQVMRDLVNSARFVPVSVADDLTWEEFSRVNVRAPELPGVRSG